MSEDLEMEYGLARAIQLAMDAERAFGIDHLPRGQRLPPGSVASPESREERHTTQSSESVAMPKGTDSPPQSAAPDRGPSSHEAVNSRIAGCESCDLCHSRTQVVPGQGPPQARLMFVGEAPGADEDESGLAFVGKAGQLLTKMIEAMGLTRDDVFIANILKCRPPGNRNPRPEEAQACFHFLHDQIKLVQPEIICTLGAQATHKLIDCSEPIGRLRGRKFDFQGAQLIPTYHPAYLLRDPSAKRAAWDDLKLVMELLGLK